MEIRSHASAESRKGDGVSKGPDLSVFPIPRKGTAKPISTGIPTEDVPAATAREKETSLEHRADVAAPAKTEMHTSVFGSEAAGRANAQPFENTHAAVPAHSGQTVATTVKLDENRYLRLSDAGRPGPGRLKRRTIQDIMVEALDEWFARRGL